MTYRSVITRALTAGVVVGVLVATYQFFVVEPTIDEAVELEEALAEGEAAASTTDPGEGHSHEEEPRFERSEQVGGGLAADVIYAVVVAAVFGTVFAAARHRLPGSSDFGRATWLGAVGFGATALVPGIKYPANPPAVGDPDTVGERTVQYLVLVAVALLLAWLLARLSGVLRRHLDDATRIVAVSAATITAYGLALVVLPGTPDTVDPAVPAGLVWDFRLRSLGALALLWTGLGLGVGWLLDRDGRGPDLPHPREAVAA